MRTVLKKILNLIVVGSLGAVILGSCGYYLYNLSIAVQGPEKIRMPEGPHAAEIKTLYLELCGSEDLVIPPGNKSIYRDQKIDELKTILHELEKTLRKIHISFKNDINLRGWHERFTHALDQEIFGPWDSETYISTFFKGNLEIKQSYDRITDKEKSDEIKDMIRTLAGYVKDAHYYYTQLKTHAWATTEEENQLQTCLDMRKKYASVLEKRYEMHISQDDFKRLSMQLPQNEKNTFAHNPKLEGENGMRQYVQDFAACCGKAPCQTLLNDIDKPAVLAEICAIIANLVEAERRREHLVKHQR